MIESSTNIGCIRDGLQTSLRGCHVERMQLPIERRTANAGVSIVDHFGALAAMMSSEVINTNYLTTRFIMIYVNILFLLV